MASRSQYASKPDPSEPWRYVCPHCEGQVTKRDAAYRFYCHGCGTGLDKDELKDKKQTE